MNRIFHRHAGMSPPLAVRGDGVYVIDNKGKRYLDASGGAAISCLGHSDPEVRRAIIAQTENLSFAHTAFFSTPVMEELAECLVREAPEGLDRVYFVSGGSEGIEAALKMARQYFVEIGQPHRQTFIARRQSYHGSTLGALAVSGNASRREPFEPLLALCRTIPPCYAYRGQGDAESAEDYGRRVADELETTILEAGPETIIAFVAETVVGATLGAVPAVDGYFRRLREICDRHAILLILDEVMCGMGRTGSLYACASEHVVPDLLVAAKGLGAGYQPIGAVLVSGRIFETIRGGSGYFRHGHSFMGHATACAAALAVQKTIKQRDLLTNVRRQGAYLRELLGQRFGPHPHVGDIRGRGLFWGLEFVADRADKEPFDPAKRLHAVIKATAMDQGLVCYPGGGCADGVAGDHILIAPPFIVTRDQVAEIVLALEKAIETALGQIA